MMYRRNLVCITTHTKEVPISKSPSDSDIGSLGFTLGGIYDHYDRNY